MKRFALLVAVAMTAVAAGASAAPEANQAITLGRGIGKIRVGMTETRLREVVGRPRVIYDRRTSFGSRSMTYEYGQADYAVRLHGRPGRLRVVGVSTTLRRERTREGIGVGSLERTVLRTYRDVRCAKPRTERHGNVDLVIEHGRTCVLRSPSGTRTTFRSYIHLKHPFEILTPEDFSRARIVQVGVGDTG